MKVGETIYAIVKPDGTIAGDCECSLISSNRECLEEDLKSTYSKDLLEQANGCKIEELKIVELKLQPTGKSEVEVGHKQDGSVDEVFLKVNGECVMHLEYMDHNQIWIGLYPNPDSDDQYDVRIGSASSIETIVENEDGDDVE